jgi:betaine-homocysteine S-methyltransferase
MIGWAVDEGADMLIGETFYYAEEAFKALEIMKKIWSSNCINNIANG